MKSPAGTRIRLRSPSDSTHASHRFEGKAPVRPQGPSANPKNLPFFSDAPTIPLKRVRLEAVKRLATTNPTNLAYALHFIWVTVAVISFESRGIGSPLSGRWSSWATVPLVSPDRLKLAAPPLATRRRIYWSLCRLAFNTGSSPLLWNSSSTLFACASSKPIWERKSRRA